MDNLEHDRLLSLLERANIDRKRALFLGNESTVMHDDVIYSDPEIVIISNRQGLRLFREMVRHFDHREKGIGDLAEPEQYPVYVLTMDAFAAGMRFGDWSVHQSMESLARLIEPDSLQDDFPGLKELLVRILAEKG